jgi:small-conductance mechanosensitive channel
MMVVQVLSQAGEAAREVGALIGDLGDTERRFIASGVVIVLLLLVRWITLLILGRNVSDLRMRYTWRKTITYIAGVVGVFVIGRIWFEGFRSIATFLGLLSAGIAIALKDPLTNFAGWAFILWRRPFDVGDRIQVGDTAGDVIDLRIFQFTLVEIGNWVHADQSTGRIIHVPNGKVFVDPVANYTRGFRFIWNELPVLVTFESDWRGAKAILERIGEQRTQHLSEAAAEEVRQAARRFLIFFTKLTPRVYTSVEDSGVLLTLRYLCDARARRSTAEEIWEDVLAAFAEHDDIDFAYPTRRLYDNLHEGKPGAWAPGDRSGVGP